MSTERPLNLYQEPSEVARFGLRIGRIRIESGDDAATAHQIVELSEVNQIEMLTIRVPTDRLALVQDLEANQFRLMDCLVYYEVSTRSVVAAAPGGFSLREAGIGDTDRVCDVARACFSDYFSHYHADARLDRGKIAEGYIDWARRCCADAAVTSAVFVSVVEDRIAGFATMRRNSDSEGEGVLVAVHPDFGGLGIHGGLIDRCKQWCHENGMTRMIISTQLSNLRVQRSWSNRGFRLFRSYFTFHRWFV